MSVSRREFLIWLPPAALAAVGALTRKPGLVDAQSGDMPYLPNSPEPGIFPNPEILNTLRLPHYIFDATTSQWLHDQLEEAGRERNKFKFSQAFAQMRAELREQTPLFERGERAPRPEVLSRRPPAGVLIGSGIGEGMIYGGWSLERSLSFGIRFDLEYSGTNLGPGSETASHDLLIAPNYVVSECYDIPNLGRAGRTYTVATLEGVPLKVIVDDWAIWGEQEIGQMTECNLGSSWIQQYVSGEELMITGEFPGGNAQLNLKADGEEAGELWLGSGEMLLVDMRSIHELQLILQTNGRDWASSIRWSSASDT